LSAARGELVIRKGFRSEIDSCSAFYENDRRTPTGLAGYLRERGLREIFLAGLATDFCVHYSAVDARRLGFETVEAGLQGDRPGGLAQRRIGGDGACRRATRQRSRLTRE
jgi:nicotinamidase/pyrazinamidase